MDIVLIGGLWLQPSVWDPVVSSLDASVVSLPVDRSTTLEDQVSAVLAAVDAASDDVFVVGHSAAATLAWIAADRRPEKVGKVGFIGGFPNADLSSYAEFFEISDGFMPFPGWEAFEGPDSADLSASQRDSFAFVPVPAEVARGKVRLTDERRYSVPAVLICPEFSPEDAREWIASGDVPELAKVKQLEFVDIDSGHWPMVTKPDELAGVLAAAA